jgi:3-hydroxyisobutyrate dehydrogenase
VLEAADQLGVPLISTAAISNMYRALQTQGLGGEGNHALIKALERLSGITVGE